MTVRTVSLNSLGWAALVVACSGEVESSPGDMGGETDGSTSAATTMGSAASTMGSAAMTGSAVSTSGSAATTGGDVSTTGAAGGAGSSASTTSGEDATTTGAGGNANDSCDGMCSVCDEGQTRFDCSWCLCQLDDDPDRETYDAFLSCDVEQPCPHAAALFSANAGAPVTRFADAECLLTALRDRTPGRFDVESQVWNGIAGTVAERAFVLDGSDQVYVASWSYSGAPGAFGPVGFSVASCVLGEPSLFEECLADPASCALMDSWYDGCFEVAAPFCPAE